MQSPCSKVISLRESGRRPSIIWTAVLPHHRAYRSVHGGSTVPCVSALPVLWFQSLIFGALEVSLSSTLRSSFSCFRITAIAHQSTFHSLPMLPLFGPSRSAPFTVLWPLLTSGRSAIHYCMGCSGIIFPCAYRSDLPR